MVNGVRISQSLRTRLTLAVLAVFLAAIWSLSYFATQLLHRNVQEMLGQQQRATVSALAALVDQGLAARLEALEHMGGRAGSALANGRAEIGAFLASRPALNEFFNGGVRAYGPNLEVVGRTDSGDIAQHRSEAEGVAAAEAIKTGRAMVGTATLCSHCGGTRFDLAAPIRDAQGRVVGALVGSIDLGLPGFLDPIAKAHFGKTGSYLLLSPRDRFVVLSSDPSTAVGPLAASDLSPKLDRLLAGETGPYLDFGHGGEKKLLTAAAIPAADWVLAAALPAREAFEPVKALQRQMALATLFFSAIAAALSWWILRVQFAPLLRAAEALRRAAESGEAVTDLPVHRPDEVGALAAAFNGMLQALRSRQAALQASEARFRQLLQHIPSVAVQGYGADTTTLYWNEASERLYGYSAEEALGRSLLDLIIPPEMRDEVGADMRRMFETGEPIPSAELSLMRKDGSRVAVFSSHAHVQVPGLDPQMFCLDIDLTERKQLEDRLRQREESLQAVLDNFPFMVWLKDCDCRYVAANQALARAFGWSSAESIVGRSDLDITSPELAEGFRASDRAVLASGTTRQAEEFVEIAGQRCWFETYKSPVAVDGRVIGTVGFARDISDRKAAEVALRESEERLRTILEQLPVGVGVLNRQGAFVLSNAVMQQFTGGKMPSRDAQQTPRWSALDASGNPIPPSEWPGARALRGEAVSPGIEFSYRGDDGCERILLVSSVPLHGRREEMVGAISVLQDITERKRAEKKLRENEALLQAVIDGSPDAIFLKDRESRLLLANPATFAVIGKPAAACLGKTDEELYDNPADGRAIMANDQRILASGKSETIEEVVRTAAGPRYYLSHKAPYRDADGNIVGLVGAARDVTERKLVEAKVRESEALLKAVLEGSPEPIFLKDRESRLVLANPATFEVIGKPAEACLGKTDEQFFFDAANGRAIMANDQRIMATGQAETVEEVVNNPSGTRYYLSTKAPYRDGAGNVVGLIGNTRDVTERKQAEASLRESEARLKAVLEGSADPIFLKDRQSRLLLASPVTFVLLGKSPEFCLGKTDEEFCDDPAEGRVIMANDARVMASGKPETVEEVVSVSSGTRYFLAKKVPWRDAAGNIIGLIGNGRDITERKQAEQRLLESEARFRGTFEQAAVGIAHIDPEGRWLRVNRKFCAISGYRQEELMGLSVGDLTGPEECAAHRQRAARLLAREINEFTVDKHYRRKGGEPVWVAITASLVWRDDGTADYFVAVVEDISARKATESALQQARDTLEQRVIERTADAEARAQALHEAERFSRATIDALAAHLCVLDEHGNILATNRAWEEFAEQNGGWRTSLGAGANYLSVCDAAARAQPPDKAASLVARRLRAMLAGRRNAFALEYECHAPDQQRWFVVKASRFAAPGPVRLLVLHENISAQKQAARASEESAAELSRLTSHLASVREEERRRIAGEVHDELGGTLTVLKLGLAVMRDSPPDPDALPARVEAIIGQADGAIQSVRRIAASLRPPMLDALGLSATIRWQAGEFSRQTGIQTLVEVPEAIDLTPDRSIAVYRIIQEALTNVARHANATQVRISIQAPNRHLDIEIQDDGCGFDSAKDRRKRSFGVVGMRERAQYLGGRLAVASAPGEGTTLRLRVPLDLAGAAQ